MNIEAYKKAMEVVGEVGVTIFNAIVSIIYILWLFFTGAIVATYCVIFKPDEIKE